MSALISRSRLLDDLFRDFASGYTLRPLHGSPLPAADRIKVDISENDDAYTVMAEIPGVSKEDIHVTVEGNVVSLHAEIKQQDSQQKDGNIVHSERYYGAVSRSFQLPVELDEAEASARYENGILTLLLRKKKIGSGSRRVAIQ